MAIARIFDGPGWSPEGYDKLLDRLFEQLGHGRRAAPGVLFHWAAQTDDGIRAVDVYESRQQADDLAQLIGPISAELGLNPPTISEFDVREYLVAAD